jgi:large subunit ribosomal protein L25
MDKAIVVPVPIHIVSEAKGAKLQGGIVDFVTREIEVECLPTDIPEHIDVDVSELALHESIRVRDLPQSPKWKAVTEGDTMIVHVVTIKVEEAPAVVEVAPAAAAPAEPEVIKKGKTEKEEEAPAKEKK